MPAATAASPWYKHLWPWIIIGILACSVTLTLSMVTIAVNNPDNLVNDNYYEAGKGINRSLDRERLAQTLQLRAKLAIQVLWLAGDIMYRIISFIFKLIRINQFVAVMMRSFYLKIIRAALTFSRQLKLKQTM